MRRALKYSAWVLILAAAAQGQVAKPVANVAAAGGSETLLGSKAVRITRANLAELERRLDGTILGIGSANEPVDLLGPTRGAYLDGFGLVFTAEFSLMLTPPISPFQPAISKETVVRVHQRKLERLIQLRKSMREMMRQSALALTQVPENQQIVIVVRLDYYGWEDTSGLPGQITMRGDRRTAMGGDEIRAEEN
jgi:hypothetical protein